MKRLRFERFLLISVKEKSAFTIKFHPKTTAIIGKNDVGKSSLLKSLYWTLGAGSADVHPTWQAAKVIGIMQFCIGNSRYYAYRAGSQFVILDDKFVVQIKTSKITSELGPFFASLLDFKLVLSARDGAPSVPPPAFAFLPFYVDQDVGWQKPWQSFSGLQQFSNFRKDLIFFIQVFDLMSIMSLRQDQPK